MPLSRENNMGKSDALWYTFFKFISFIVKKESSVKISSKANRAIAILFFVSFILTGCAGRDPSISVSSLVPSAEKPAVSSSPSVLPSSSPFILEEDWSDFFHGMNGTAIFWNPGKNEYSVHNSALALVRRSPCSTFKIVSSAVAWDIGLFASGTTTRQWSGEQFWNPEWNQDLDFPHAFRTSCVWYFREIVDEIGRERMLAALRQLQYGNCDISDWEGKQNTNNSNPALTGFWIESSLRISPQEQVEVLERIFGKDSPYSFNTISQLKNAMLIQESVAGGPVYGKTGMGKNLGVVADAWFIGFQERNEGNLYFCVYLGENENSSTSSKMAKEIALNILRSIPV